MVAAGVGTTEVTRRRVLALTLVGVAVLVLAAWGTSVVLADAQQARGSDEALCTEYDTLMALLADPGAFATQATNRSARRLSSLADDSPSPDVAAAGSTIRTVVASVAWERSDLVAATRPVALSCSWRWPVGSAPPVVTPRPPTR